MLRVASPVTVVADVDVNSESRSDGCVPSNAAGMRRSAVPATMSAVNAVRTSRAGFSEAEISRHLVTRNVTAIADLLGWLYVTLRVSSLGKFGGAALR